MNTKTALIVVDVQNDFCEGGSLEVPMASTMIPTLNALMEKFSKAGIPIVATQDWHPPKHCSFASTYVVKPFSIGKDGQTMWPDHCVQNTKGAEFHPDVEDKYFDAIIQKGCNKDVDSYSGFYDNKRINKTPLMDWLKERKIEKVYIAGLALDYCVAWTARDAEDEFDTYIIVDATKGIEANPGDIYAVRTMHNMITATEVLRAEELL